MINKTTITLSYDKKTKEELIQGLNLALEPYIGKIVSDELKYDIMNKLLSWKN